MSRRNARPRTPRSLKNSRRKRAARVDYNLFAQILPAPRDHLFRNALDRRIRHAQPQDARIQFRPAPIGSPNYLARRNAALPQGSTQR